MALLMLVGPKCCSHIVRIESFAVNLNVMRGKFWCMLLSVVIFNTWKVSSCKH